MGAKDGPIYVLHVDDDPEVAELAATFLKRENEEFEVETVTSAREALDRLAEDKFDCVISDYEMPGENGIEFLETLRETHADLPFILYTGKGSEQVASAAISAGATDYLQKETGTGQYELLANRIRNAVTQARSEKQLRETREEYATVFEGAQNGLLLVNVESEGFRYQRCNPRAVELIGRDTKDIVGKTPQEALGSENGKKVTAAYRRSIEQREAVLSTVTLTLPVGTVTWEVKVTPVMSNGTTEQLVVSFHDITDHEESKRKLRQLKEEYETVFDTAQDGIFLFDVEETDGDYEFKLRNLNPAHEAISGMSAEQDRGKTPHELLGNEKGQEVVANYRRCVEAREPISYEEELQMPARTVHLQTKLAPVIDDGEVTAIVGIGRDISQLV